jgi:DNA-binding NarL/FixJ family response regulator
VRVLVVDDQELVRAGFSAILSRAGVEVVGEAADGQDAVDQASALRPDVVLMDVRMPRLDGIEATRRIVSSHPEIHVVVLTTFDLDEYIFQALSAGASGFVLKDDPPESLIAAIRTVAAGDALLSPSITKRVIRRFATLPQATAPSSLGELTAREEEVLRLLARGLSNAEIADRLFVSEGTVKTHVTHVLQKLDLRDRVQAVVFAFRHGLVDARAD